MKKWAVLASEDPNPIYTDLKSLKDLFPYIFTDSTEKTQAIADFSNAITNYCENHNCKSSFSTGSLPSAAVRKLSSPLYGGLAGFSFSYYPPSSLVAALS